MSKIHLLPPDVINQIAAGEVVERPAHLVKELIENSLDAGSTSIHVQISSGGREVIISDDGVGINQADLKTALLRHATSKINKSEDLWNLVSYGFRGEALASISSVCEMKIISKSVDENEAASITCEFGRMSSPTLAHRLQGTEIRIHKLFENVPARLKFLKSNSAEVAQIKTVFKALSLAYPNVEFKLLVESELIYFYPKNQSAKERAQTVLDISDLFESTAHRDGYVTTSYYASPHQVAKTSKNIWIFAQGRWIQDRSLQAAVMEAYRNLLMHGEFPFVVIFLKCPTDQIDVNISPTKSQVKFQDPSLAFRSVQASLRDGLETAPWIRNHIQASVDQKKIQHSQEVVQSSYEVPQTSYQFQDQSFHQTSYKTKNDQSENHFFSRSEKNFQEKTLIRDTVSNLAALKVSEDDLKTKYWGQFQVIGQLNLTYIVCQKEDRLILVDQHAAHERVGFERLMNKWKGGDLDLQSFLFPLSIDLTEEKCEVLIRKQNDLMKMGLEIEQLGPMTIGVKSAPSILKESGIAQALVKMADQIFDHGDSFEFEKFIGDIFATMACHSVVRAGQSLSLNEMIELLKAMDEFPLSSFCPHGRPVSIEMTFTEIEKKFGRLV